MLAILLAWFAFTCFTGSASQNPIKGDTVAVSTAQSSHPSEFASGETPQQESQRDLIHFMMDIVLILLAAKIGGEIFERIGQPAVLGELLLGVIIGNMAFTGISYFETLKSHEGIRLAAEIGVILLLFEVGLESRIKDLLSVGISSFLAALAGVAAPMALGFGAGLLLLPRESLYVDLFLGATLAATSVGITARVLKDLRKMHLRESKIILGAAVIDDVLGLIVLAVVTGLITTAATTGQAEISFAVVGLIILKAFAFLFGAIVLGQLCARPFIQTLSRLRTKGVMLAASISICFVFASIAALIGLAPIVGAFAAGLILEPSYYQGFLDKGERSVEEMISPVSQLFVPVFFVLMGMQVDISSFLDNSVLGLAAGLIIAAIAGKMVCGLFVVEKGLNRILISAGMIPRGEVGLIFASIGAGLRIGGEPVVNPSTYSAVVVMVMVTTLITPIWLKAIFSKDDKKQLLAS